MKHYISKLLSTMLDWFLVIQMLWIYCSFGIGPVVATLMGWEYAVYVAPLYIILAWIFFGPVSLICFAFFIWNED